MMAGAVYILCTLTCILCAVLLLRSYSEKKVRLLLWGGLCFAGLAVSNVLLFVDLVIFPDVDLSIPRHLVSLAGVSLLLYAFIWDMRQ
jgi:hypothetical protein